MSRDSADPDTLAFYEDNAVFYIGQRPDRVNSEVLPFLDLLKPGARILELGCGGGQDARYMIQRGFDVELTDGAAAMAEQASKLSSRPVRVMRFDELDDKAAYDAVIASASLLHIPRGGLPDVLTRIWCALKPGGWHLATFKTGDTEGYDEHGRYYNYISQAEADALYSGAGEWESLEYQTYEGSGYFSQPAKWLAVTARKITSPETAEVFLQQP